MTTTKRRGTNTAPAAIAALVLSGGVLAGCGEQEETVVYCVNEDDEVVDDDQCDEDGNTSSGGVFFFMAGNYNSGLKPGTKLDRNMGSRISPADTVAREKAGLPSKGKVTTGKSGTYFKPGGFGTFKGGSSGS